MELTGLETSAIDAPTPTTRRMPDLAGGTHAHAHSVHSALVSLSLAGVQSHRISLRRVGRQAAPSGTVVGQQPRAGTPLDDHDAIQLDIAGLGFTHALPVGMWDAGDEREPGTREILAAFDDPFTKLRHWFHEGAPLFRIAPDDPQACARWLALFGIDAEEWPRPMWYRLASLASRLSELSCSEAGWAFVCEVLLELPVASFTYHQQFAKMPAAALSSIGGQASTLGVDMVLGDRVEDLARLTIEFGPVPLKTHDRFVHDAASAKLMEHVLRLVMPFSTVYEIAWLVEDKRQSPRLGIAEANSRLGINTHMGMTPDQVDGAVAWHAGIEDADSESKEGDSGLRLE